MENRHSVVDKKILLKSDNRLELELFIPQESDLFDGHFPEFLLLPAVGQFAIVCRVAHEYFFPESKFLFVSEIRRMKFQAPVLPNTSLVLCLENDAQKGSVRFEFLDFANRSKIYSKGILHLAESSGENT